jgi:sugar phosphate isomerase/epimerase
MLRGIGINCDEAAIDGRVERLDTELARVLGAGFDCYELSITAANMIRAGRPVQAEVDRVKQVLEHRPLRYTIHLPNNLRLTDPTGMGQACMRTCLDVAHQVRADVVVYHSAQIALRSSDQDAWPLPDERQLRDLRQRETDALRQMARQAEDLGILIAVENRDPHLWELAALVRHSRQPSDLLTYHAGMNLDVLVDQVTEISSPAVGLCLDVGHAYLAAPYWPDRDYLGGIRRAAAWVRHVHYHDNFGRLDDAADLVSERLVFGEADTHMPPGWGDIPLPAVLGILQQADYQGWLVTELQPRYAEYWPEVAATVRRRLADAGLLTIRAGHP